MLEAARPGPAGLEAPGHDESRGGGESRPLLAAGVARQRELLLRGKAMVGCCRGLLLAMMELCG